MNLSEEIEEAYEDEQQFFEGNIEEEEELDRSR